MYSPPMVLCPLMSSSTKNWGLFSGLLIVGLIATAMLMLALAEFHEEIMEPDSVQIESHLQDEVHEGTNSALTEIMFALSWIGSPIVMVPTVAILATTLWRKCLHHAAALLLISSTGAGVLVVMLKLHFRRLRPTVPWALAHEPSFSFPSGHSVFAVVLYGTLIYLEIRHLPDTRGRIAIIVSAIALIFGIGYSRIYLGVHYPSDVLAGYLVGTVWLMTIIGSDWYVQRAKLGE